jgi:energy-coupling factor transporter ATP-binding protein EcfA2
MRISSLTVNRWRNLEGVHLEVPVDASLVCLVGENGTGKSNVLELIAGIAANLGLAPSVQMKRGVYELEPHDVSLTLQLSESFKLPSLQPGNENYGNLLADWDRSLTYRSANMPVTGSVGLPSGVSAGGIADPASATNFGNMVVASLLAQPEVSHLYLDAERSFPVLNLQDQEIWNLWRQDLKLPAYVRQQAAVMTQNMYSEWLKSMLAQAMRSQRDYHELATQAARAGKPIPAPVDELAGLRHGITKVLPHLQLTRLDQDQRTLFFDSAGQDLRYENLSGGEQEIVFLVGQIERFQLRHGLLLLDEPELHLNPDLLRTWMEYVRDSVDTGQVWIATHALEAVEVTGLQASMVFERAEDRHVRSVGPLGDRPVLSTLAGAVGTPALSLARSRFVLVEGERPRRERERFAKVLDSPPSDRFVEVGGCEDVLRKFAVLRELATETEQLRLGAIIDRDLRTAEQVRKLQAATGVHVLPVHEIENYFLEPAVLRALLEQTGLTSADPHSLVKEHSDRRAGRWILERARVDQEWPNLDIAVREAVRTMTWDEVAANIESQMRALAELDSSVDGAEQARRRVTFVKAARAYEALRGQPDELWKYCFGKEVLLRVAIDLGFKTAEAMESRALQLWSRQIVPRPALIAETRAYLDAIQVLG